MREVRAPRSSQGPDEPARGRRPYDLPASHLPCFVRALARFRRTGGARGRVRETRLMHNPRLLLAGTARLEPGEIAGLPARGPVGTVTRSRIADR